MDVAIDFLETDFGYLKIQADDHHLREVIFLDKPEPEASPNEITKLTLKQITEYLEGQRKEFQLPLMAEGTAFQKKVWEELCNIPFGTSISYLELAHRLGDPKVIRAAASANGKNPISIIIPCHRVIGSDGSLVGYGGGLHRKKWLLKHENHPIYRYKQLGIFD